MFITFEGIDGCGKSTQIRLLAAEFSNLGLETILLREPGGTDLSEKIREILLKSKFAVSSSVELLLFEAARSHLVDNIIKPALSAGKFVLSDRFYDSTTAYQGYGRGIDLESVHLCNNIATNGLKPDITFFLDIPVQEAKSRAGSKNKDKIEASGDDFFDRVREGFIKISKEEPNRFFRIDASGTVDETHDLIMQKFMVLYSSIRK